LATDEVLAERAGSGASPPTLRLYTYRPHCVLVGRFQDAAYEVRLRRCAEEGIDVNRRPTGGGAILMGPDQLGVALALPKQPGGLRQLMTGFSTNLIRGLATFGIDARFRGKNDLAVNGRKIAGLGIHRTATGGLLFHASLLVDLDVRLMTSVLRTPFKRIGDRERGVVRRRIATVREHAGRELPMSELRGVMAGTFDAVDRGAMTEDEGVAVDQRERERYADPRWLAQNNHVPDTTGRAAIRTTAGTVDVRVAVAGGTIKAAWVRGDFLADEHLIADVEGQLRWHTGDPDAIARTVTRAWDRAGAIDTLAPEAIVEAVNAAVSRATTGTASPYGCFVEPEPTHD